MPLEIPIIGQPQIGDWMFAVNIVCVCKQVTLLAGRPGSTAVCSNTACGKLFRLNGFPTLAPNGVDIVVPLAIGNLRSLETESGIEKRD